MVLGVYELDVLDGEVLACLQALCLSDLAEGALAQALFDLVSLGNLCPRIVLADLALVRA